MSFNWSPRNRKLAIGLFGLALYVLAALTAGLVSHVYGWDQFASDLSLQSFPAPPTTEHWFGTDDRGRDVFVRLLHGTRYSLGFALIVWSLSYSIGIVVGAMMAYAGGIIDLIGQRVIEVFETIPFLYLALLILSGLGRGFTVLVFVNVLSGWMMISVYMRGQILKEKSGFVAESAKALGASRSRVLFRHILPSSILPVFIFSPLALASYLLTLVQLDFLGLGLQPPTPSWGELLEQANRHFPEAWWLLLFPLLALLGILLSFQAVSSGIKNS